MTKKQKTIVHVNQHNIKWNAKNGNLKPVLTVKQGKQNTYTNEILIEGPCRIIYSPDKPLSCGARVWIETESGIQFLSEPMTYQETKQICSK